jgi:hypothetical protein
LWVALFVLGKGKIVFGIGLALGKGRLLLFIGFGVSSLLGRNFQGTFFSEVVHFFQGEVKV